MSLTLIHPGDMDLDVAVAVNSGKDDLLAAVRRYYDEVITSIPKPWHEEDQGYYAQERDALLTMIKEHKDWGQGVHELRIIHPHWSPWYLIVCETQISYPK